MRHGVIGAFVAFLLFGSSPLFAADQAATKSLVGADWLAAHLDAPGLVVLDIRNRIDGGSREIFAKGHIPGAVYSDYLGDGWRVARDGVPGMLPPVTDLEKLIGGLGIGNDTHVVIVPGGVSAVDYGSATRVFWTFKVLGHDKVSILDGGYKGWVADAKRAVAMGPSNRPAPCVLGAPARPC
ncbi:MAG: sulfurtransferase, partial [Rhodospirillales bacterium]|nr:sulfurtransferase [Rhodospirillales bacterium]